MAAPSLLYRLTLALSSVAHPGAAEATERSLTPSGLFVKGSSDRVELSGSGTKALDFSTIAPSGAKMVLVYFEQGTNNTPIELDLGTDVVELTPGGIFLIHNPNATAGMTSLSVNFTTDGILWCRVLG